MKAIKIIKNRSDIGAGTRGSDMGIDAIEIAAINQNNEYFNRHLFQDVVTQMKLSIIRTQITLQNGLSMLLNNAKEFRTPLVKI
jgi:arginase